MLKLYEIEKNIKNNNDITTNQINEISKILEQNEIDKLNDIKNDITNTNRVLDELKNNMNNNNKMNYMLVYLYGTGFNTMFAKFIR